MKGISKSALKQSAMRVKNGVTTLEQESKDFASKNDIGVLEARALIIFAIGIIVLAAILPSALSAVHAANTSGWSTAETGIWSVLGIVVIGVAIYKLIE